MATRTITARGYSGDPLYNYDGSTKTFTVESATDAISLSTALSCDRFRALVTITELRTYYATSMLHLRHDSKDGDIVAKVGPLAKDGTPHEISMYASQMMTSLLTKSFTSIHMELKDSNYGAEEILGRNEINGTIQIVVQCAGRCTLPGVPYLSASKSTGNAVVLQWSAGSGGVDNALSYYKVERQLSTNGGYSWGEWESLTQTANTYAVVQPPATVGHMYRYKVRAVGTAGEYWGSDWYVSENLLRVEITRCGTPGSFTLSASESSGSVRMSWTAGANGTENNVSHYEVQRSLSTDGGSTWGAWANVGTTSGLYMWVEPPETVGHIYKFYIRTVGSAGTDYASYWMECGKTLKKVKAALVAYTDPEILPGITKVKAAHITELQTNINLVRTAANYSAYEFTSIRAGYTNLNAWNAHIAELRTAIDGLGVSHEAWLTLGVNCPRADVLMQLRRVVEAVADD